ncbi:MAG: UDP-N-acetylglucosamine 2-epimerase (non-hydrolyzing) [Chloroflexota bacterium]|nr:UDP-N-acetylglucosamine 2-epimerase (non-hydrolyzing) [Chloroflexota bacterium]
MKVLCIFGTRPEAIKMAPVLHHLRQFPGTISAKACVTGQHRQMLDQVLQVFDIQPDYDLSIMTEDQTLATLTARALTALDPVIAQEQPDWILVQGDTTTAMVGTLAAFYHRLQVGHVEAGLRTWNKYHPFPEEVNRRIVDSIADLHFAPTQWAADNLLREGVPESGVLVSGNTVVDALISVTEKPLSEQTGRLLRELGVPSAAGHPDAEGDRPPLLLVTAHRRENFGGPLENICDALGEIARQRSDVRVVFLVHLNPNVQKVVRSRLGRATNISLIPPVDYQTMAHLMKHSYLILTDSGGLQEEAPTFHVPVLVMRETTERPEALQAGTARLVGTQADDIVDNVLRLLDGSDEYRAMSGAPNPFGDGHAAPRIVKALMERAARTDYGA